MQEMLDEEDLQDNEKYAKIIQDQAAYDDKILGVNKILSPILWWHVHFMKLHCYIMEYTLLCIFFK